MLGVAGIYSAQVHPFSQHILKLFPGPVLDAWDIKISDILFLP